MGNADWDRGNRMRVPKGPVVALLILLVAALATAVASGASTHSLTPAFPPPPPPSPRRAAGGSRPPRSGHPDPQHPDLAEPAQQPGSERTIDPERTGDSPHAGSARAN